MDKKIIRKLSGVVKSDKMQKTLVVSVESIKIHPKYQKRYQSTRTYKVHDGQGRYHQGDKVDFVACRPLSKDKRWRVLYQ